MTSRVESPITEGFKVSWIVDGIEFPLREMAAGEFVALHRDTWAQVPVYWARIGGSIKYWPPLHGDVDPRVREKLG